MIFRQLFISLFSIALAFADTSPQTLQTVVDEKIVPIASEKKLPGFALTIVQGGKVICTKLFGVASLKTKRPITEKTIFQLGSVSKTYASTLVGILLEKELISLSDKIANVLDSLSFPEGIEVKHVLSHTTGFPKYGFNPLIESEKKSFYEIAEQLSKTPLVSAPSEKYDYHNVAYSLIDPYVAKKTGESFESNFKKNVVDVLKLEHTSMSLSDLIKEEDRASPHVKTNTGFVACGTYRKGYYEVAPAGGINSSIHDIAIMISLHLGHYPNVMSQKTLDLLHTPIIPAKDVFERNPGNYKRFTGSHYGLGWRILEYKGHKIVFHGGWIKGFINIIVLIPEKDIGIAILQNAETSFPWVAAMTLVDAIFDFPEQNWDTVKPVKQNKKASKTVKKAVHAKKATKISKPHKKKAKIVKETVVS